MKKILVSGDSIPYGIGFPLEKNEPSIWPNQLASFLEAEVTNVSISGYDNTGIFINAISEFLTTEYDLILIQLSTLERVVLSPNMHTRINITNATIDSLKNQISVMAIPQFSKDQLLNFHKIFFELNGKYDHWERLIRIIYSIQSLAKQGYNIRIINGLLDWPEELFSNKYSLYAKKILNYDSLPDEDIEVGLEKIYKQIKDIDLSIWMNPFNPFGRVAVDYAPLDNHPGSKSHKIYTDMILKNLNMI
jgi:hypothetical protein